VALVALPTPRRRAGASDFPHRTIAMSPVEFRNIELALEFRVATRRIRAIEFRVGHQWCRPRYPWLYRPHDSL